MLIYLVVLIWIWLLWGATETRRPTNKLFVGHPECFWVHKSFVIEPWRHGAPGELPNQPHEIEAQTRPAAGRRRNQSLVQGLLRRSDIGDLCRLGRTQLHDGVGLFRTGCHDASGSRVFKTSRHGRNTIGKQGRGQRVSLKTGEGFSTPLEGYRTVPINPSTRVQSIRLAHESAAPNGASPLG